MRYAWALLVVVGCSESNHSVAPEVAPLPAPHRPFPPPQPTFVEEEAQIVAGLCECAEPACIAGVEQELEAFLHRREVSFAPFPSDSDWEKLRDRLHQCLAPDLSAAPGPELETCPPGDDFSAAWYYHGHPSGNAMLKPRDHGTRLSWTLLPWFQRYWIRCHYGERHLDRPLGFGPIMCSQSLPNRADQRCYRIALRKNRTAASDALDSHAVTQPR